MSAESPIVDLASQRAQRRTDRRAALRAAQAASTRSAVVHAFPAPAPPRDAGPDLPDAGPGPASPFGPVMAFGMRAGAELIDPRVLRPVADDPADGVRCPGVPGADPRAEPTASPSGRP